MALALFFAEIFAIRLFRAKISYRAMVLEVFFVHLVFKKSFFLVRFPLPMKMVEGGRWYRPLFSGSMGKGFIEGEETLALRPGFSIFIGGTRSFSVELGSVVFRGDGGQGPTNVGVLSEDLGRSGMIGVIDREGSIVFSRESETVGVVDDKEL